MLLPWREFNFQLQIRGATKLWLLWDQKDAIEAKKEGYFAICAVAKLLLKEK